MCNVTRYLGYIKPLRTSKQFEWHRGSGVHQIVRSAALIELPDVFKANVLNRVRLSVAVIEVPPLELINREALCLHMPPQQVA